MSCTGQLTRLTLQRLALHPWKAGLLHPFRDEKMSYFEREQTRIRRAQKQAQSLEQELLTSGGVARLFGISASTVRAAKHRGRIHPRFILRLHREMSVYLLRDAVAVWGAPEDEAELERMRRAGHPLGIGQAVFNVLHPTPIASLHDL